MPQVAEKIDEQELAQEELTPDVIAAKLDAIGAAVIEMRHEAVKARRICGIEDVWREDEEFYEGIDEYNEEGDNNWNIKPPGRANPARKQTGSTVFLNVTGPYCDIAAARMGDMLLPTDESNFSIDATPIPELIEIANGNVPQGIAEQAASFNNTNVESAATDLQQEATSQIEEAKKKSDNAQKKINDWLVQCQYQAQVRSVLEDIAKAGTGVLKGPVPEERKTIAYVDGELKVSNAIEPCSYRVDYWNCYPDLSCGDNIHNGSYFFERDEITPKKLRSLKGSGLYFDYQIDRALRQGPMALANEHKRDDDYVQRGLQKCEKKSVFAIWYGYITLLREDVEALALELDDDQEAIDVKITMINNIVIQLDQNHIDTGEFPYDFMVWKKRKNSPFGTGVSRLIKTPQRIINGAARSLMDNAGIAAGPMWVINQGLVEPVNGVYEIAPLKGWKLAEDAEIEDVSKAFSYFNVDMMQNDLQAIITLGLNMAEQVTGIPLILRGHAGNAPDTVGGMRMLQNNASTTLRRIAKLFDDLITEPHMRRYYAYLLQYGPDDAKGDFQIDAKGSAALIERDIQNQSIMGMGNLAANPVYGIDPKKWAKELLASQRLDYGKFEYDDEQWEQIVTQMSQPPADSRLEVEQLRQQSAQQQLQFKGEQAERDRQTQIFMQQLQTDNNALIEQGKQELTMAQIQQRYQEHLEKLESEEAQTILKLRVQQALSQERSNPNTQQMLIPPSEPAGRAPDGQAYQR